MPDLNDKSIKPDADSLDQSKYLIYSRLEIATILGTLSKAGTMVTAYFGSGSDFILTSIAAVRPENDRVYIDYGANDEANQRALKSTKITFVAAHDRIKIQFVADSLRPAKLGGREVFSMAVPTSLLRLQRRDNFRIATPLTKPLLCVIPAQPGAPRVPPSATVIDISCGGIAVIDSTEPAGIETGAHLRGCRLDLPEQGEISTDIIVRSTFEVTYRNGATHRRAGCEFVDIRERDRAIIQRYISKLERERRDRSSGR